MEKDFKHIRLDLGDIEGIDKNSWLEAEGVKSSPGETNSMLATRDYEVECYYPHKVGVFHGFWLWWCDRHAQFLFMCERERAKLKAVEFAEAVIRSDKTNDYEYGGEKSVNNERQAPPKGSRWLSPRELARDFVKSLKR